MNSPLISVLTTVYNREKYLKDCIESVLASTYQDWELIIVDDKSVDSSYTIAKFYESKDSRIKVYLNESNLGDYHNRNKAASYAKGKYLKYLDADDLVYPHGLELMVETMEKFPNAGLGISQEVVEDYQPYPFEMSPQETFKRELLQRGVLGLGPTGTIIRREYFENLGGFSGTRYIGDTELWYQLALNYSVVKMVPGLTFWRRHDDQEITKGKQSYFYLENNYKHLISILNNPKLPLSNEDILRVKGNINQRFSRDVVKLMVFQFEIKKGLKILSECDFPLLKVIKSL